MPDRTVLRVHLLGGFRVAVGEQPVPGTAWRQKRAAAVVKLLALAPMHRLHREQLVETLWPELDAEVGANNLRFALHHARTRLTEAGAALGAFLDRDGESLLLGSSEAVWVDVDTFEGAAAHAWRAADPEATEAALEKYAGELLPEDPYDEWAERRRAGLRASHLALLTRLAHLAEHCGDLDRAIAAQQRILGVEPAQEEAHVALMRCFALAGRRTQALAQYRRLVAVLEHEVGAAPEPATVALHDAIQANQFPQRHGSRTPATAAGWTNLPAPVDTLIGREREVAEIRQLLATARLVTLTGPGGVGKTRLALAVARTLETAFPDGACFVDLAPIRDPTLVVSAISQALGVREAGGQRLGEVIAATLRDKRVLLLLDNFEQVVEAAGVVVDLLAACPRLVILTTSRTRLRLRGEREYPVPPLVVPTAPGDVVTAEVAASPAGRLFAERAREARPDFALTSDNAVAIAEICRRLDGLPLALELAAARVRVLSPEMLRERLEAPLAVLTGGARDLPERQQTIRGAIAWSYDLLRPEERALFRQLAVFAGSWTLAAAEAVADPKGELGVGVLDGLASLVDQSLVVDRGVAGGEPRFGMLETIREYAAEQLTATGELDAARDVHAVYYLSRAEAEGPKLRESPWTPEHHAIRARIASDLPNYRAADGRLRARRDAEAALRLGVALRRFLHQAEALREGAVWFERLLAVPGVDQYPSLYLDALGAAANAADWQGNLDLGWTRFEQVMSAARNIGHRRWEAEAFMRLGELRLARGEADAAEPMLVEAEAMALALGDGDTAAAAANFRGSAAFAVGDFDAALRHYERAREGFIAVENAHAVAATYAGSALALTQAGKYEQSRSMFLRALDMDNIEHADWTTTYCLSGLAGLAAEIGYTAEAGRLYGAATASQATLGIPFSAAVQAAHDQWQAKARSTLGEEQWAYAIASGEALSLPEAITVARGSAVLTGSSGSPVIDP